jgi:hypothetical protein
LLVEFAQVLCHHGVLALALAELHEAPVAVLPRLRVACAAAFRPRSGPARFYQSSS